MPWKNQRRNRARSIIALLRGANLLNCEMATTALRDLGVAYIRVVTISHFHED